MSKLEIGFCSDVGYGRNRDKTQYPEAEYVEIISIDDLVSALIDRESGDIPWMFKNHVWLLKIQNKYYLVK